MGGNSASSTSSTIDVGQIIDGYRLLLHRFSDSKVKSEMRIARLMPRATDYPAVTGTSVMVSFPKISISEQESIV